MKSSPYLIALKIAQIVEEHQEKDIRVAVQILERAGQSSALLDYLFGREENSDKARSSTKHGRDSADSSLSRAISKLRDTDPDKFRLLSEFEAMIKKGQVLSTHENVKRFGERISKDFYPKKSRKETIGPLLEILADRPLSELEKLVEYAASFGVSGSTDEYQRLAQFLISGKKSEAS